MQEIKVQNIIYRFANSFDQKDWEALKNTLSDVIECDYEDLRQTNQKQTKEEYVALRMDALQTLNTQHLFSNLEMKVTDNKAQCQLSALIIRRNESGTKFDTHASYSFQLLMNNGEWLISKIKQKVLWNDGDPKIHPAL